MFGGFDGEFYNDLYALNLNEIQKNSTKVSDSTIDQDMVKLINNPELNDLKIIVTKESSSLNCFSTMIQQEFYVCKALVLQRVFEREIQYALSKKIDADQKLSQDIAKSTIVEVMNSDHLRTLVP